MKNDHFRRLERMYLAAPCNKIYRPQITIREGEAEVASDVGPHLHHAGDAVHGSSYFKAMDDAASAGGVSDFEIAPAKVRAK